MRNPRPAPALTLVLAASLAACVDFTFPTAPIRNVVDITAEVTVNGIPTDSASVHASALDQDFCFGFSCGKGHPLWSELIGPGLYRIYEEVTWEDCGRFRLHIGYAVDPDAMEYVSHEFEWSGCEPKRFKHDFEVAIPHT